jgi:hypothetical protein
VSAAQRAAVVREEARSDVFAPPFSALELPRNWCVLLATYPIPAPGWVRKGVSSHTRRPFHFWDRENPEIAVASYHTIDFDRDEFLAWFCAWRSLWGCLMSVTGGSKPASALTAAVGRRWTTL